VHIAVRRVHKENCLTMKKKESQIINHHSGSGDRQIFDLQDVTLMETSENQS
jgi:hypothetical protein